MQEDFIACLTRQVKEDVVENYLTERRIIELQVEEITGHADEVRAAAEQAGRRLTRLGYLVIHPDMLGTLNSLLGNVEPSSYWCECLKKPFKRGVRLIRVTALTSKTKYAKLLVEAYRRLCRWMDDYAEQYENLEKERRAVNHNIQKFHSNFDLLSIINFLKSLDVCTIERKHFLGENFSAKELSSIDEKLYIRKISAERLEVPPPLELPDPELLEKPLTQLAQEVYRKYQSQAKRLLK